VFDIATFFVKNSIPAFLVSLVELGRIWRCWSWNSLNRPVVGETSARWRSGYQCQ